MRLFEFGLLVGLILLLARLYAPAAWRTIPWLGMMTLALLIVSFVGHFAIEGTRWQMWPIYLLAVGLTVPLVWQLFSPPVALGSRRWPSWIGIGLLTLFSIIAILPPFLFPVRELPRPTGPYATGTVTFSHTDRSRAEIFGPEPGGPRRFVSQIWYPAAAGTAGQTADLIPGGQITTQTLSARLGLPPFALSHLRLINPYSIAEAPITTEAPDSGFPVLLFSHGYNSYRSQSMTLMEELASHGYIVIAPTHTYGSSITVFPNGEIIFHDPDTLIGEGEILRRTGLTLGEQWAGDILFLFDYLAEINADPNSPFFQAIDLDRLGLFGHSTGGGVIFRVCHADNRCKAAIGLDAWFGPVPDETLTAGNPVPSYFLMSEAWPKPENVASIRQFMGATSGQNRPTGWATITGTNHYDFADIPFLSPLTRYLELSGTVDAYRGQEINRAVVRQFFDLYLKEEGDGSLLSDGGDAYPELSYGIPKKFGQE